MFHNVCTKRTRYVQSTSTRWMKNVPLKQGTCADAGYTHTHVNMPGQSIDWPLQMTDVCRYERANL